MNKYERIGRMVVLPILILGMLVVLPVIIPLFIMFYPVGVLLTFRDLGKTLPGETPLPLGERIKYSLLWPLNILALNEFMSLGGLDNKYLSRFTDWMNERYQRRLDRREHKKGNR